ncbi:DMT family transporter [Sphingomonas trueperi]|uniref:DMT family transporter n=1 Tax=Sphingomonas trueperi TaxID=53317 RepID=UPI000EB09EF0
MQLLAPIIFVLIWSTGFIVARATTPYASAELVLTARLVLTALLLGVAALLAGQRLPRGRALALHLAAGSLLNGVYLGASWWAIAAGMPAGVMALLGSLQPLIVALGSFVLLSERLRPRAWLGLAIGLAGVMLVLYPLLGRSSAQPIAPLALAAAIGAILAMAGGTMIQRGGAARDPMLVAGAVQHMAGALLCGAAALLLGEHRWANVLPLWLGLGWSVFGLSVVGVSLLVWMTRAQGATRVSALLLLVPPLAAIEAWLLFGEQLVSLQLLGFAAALGGVILARSRPTAGSPNEATV